MRIIVFFSSLLLSLPALAQSYSTMAWGIDKSVSPYGFGYNINGTWYNLGTISSTGTWVIPVGNITNGGLPILSSANIWAGAQTFSVAPKFSSMTGYMYCNGAAPCTASTSVPAANVSFTQSGTGAVSTNINALLQAGALTGEQFGVVCDGVTNNTTSLNNLISAARAAGKPAIIPPGICKTDMIDLGLSAGQQVSIYGYGTNAAGTTLDKITSDGNPIIKANTSTTTTFFPYLTISGIKLDGISGNTPDALQLYNVVFGNFQNITVVNSIHGVGVYGGNTNSFNNLTATSNTIGFYATQYVSPAPFTYPPNLITLNNPILSNNSYRGCYYELGSGFFINNADIEGNGNAGNANTGGCYINGVASTIGGLGGIGAIIKGSWFETNAGGNSVWLNGGHNEIDGTLFIANGSSTDDIKISLGTYTISNSNFVGIKSGYSINETVAASYGNFIYNTSYVSATYDPKKTSFFSGSKSTISAFQLTPYTVGALPTCNVGTTNSLYAVSDSAIVPTYNGALGAGGGTNVSPVFCDGTGWKFH